MNVIDLREWESTALGGPGAEAVARQVHRRHGRHFEVTAPGPLTSSSWTLCSTGLVGYLPLDAGCALRIAPKVPIASLLAMLELAYELPSLTWYDGLASTAPIEGLFETLASILCRRIGDRTRKGLYRAYVEERDELQAVRGRVLPRESMARTARGSVALVCEYETLTDNLFENQVLLWTLERLRRVVLGREDVRRAVRAQHRTLAATLDLVPYRAEDCVGRPYHQLNYDYRAIHALCRLVLDLCGPATVAGPTETIPFTVDMPKLFELFVARWLRTQLAGWTVEAQHRIELGSGLSYPVDLVVRDPANGRPLAVIDTKYKDDKRPAADDVQQVVFYATALGCREAWLLYPRPVSSVHVVAGPVTVRTFGIDLSHLELLPACRDALASALANAVAPVGSGSPRPDRIR